MLHSTQVELQGKLRSRLPKSLSRKMTHIAVGSFLLLGMSMMPVGHSWTGKFVTCLVIYGFMMGFSFAAYIPDKDLQKLPSFVRAKPLSPPTLTAQVMNARVNA